MDKKGAKGYWISTSRIINQELFDEYVNKVGPWLKDIGGEVFAKDTQPLGKEITEDCNLAVICEFPSMIRKGDIQIRKALSLRYTLMNFLFQHM